MRVFITGDRSMNPVLAVAVVSRALAEIGARYELSQSDISTGDLATGVEKAVRYLLPDCHVFFYPRDKDGTPLFERAYGVLAPNTDIVVILHTDPLSSKITKAAMAQFPQHSILMPVLLTPDESDMFNP